MSDPVDQANDIMQQNIENALNNRKQPAHTSYTECQDCGDAIPQARRVVARGCTRCASCQEDYEARNKHRR